MTKSLQNYKAVVIPCYALRLLNEKAGLGHDEYCNHN
jgi:hypothetical protein